MAILVNEQTRLVIQGLGRAGKFHTTLMMEAGTKVVAGVKPGAAGTMWEDVPLFNTLSEAVAATGANTSCIFVPPPGAADAIMEATDAELELAVCITEGIPTLDMIRVRRYLEGKKTKLVGPNCPGVITPGVAKVGIMPWHVHRPGSIGVISRSGTLTYEAVGQLTALGLGQSTCIGIGGDPVGGLDFVDVLGLFEKDEATEAVIMIGEIGGSAEEKAAAFVADQMSKPVAAFVAGQTAPPGKRMGHAGAIIAGGKGTADEKIAALRAAGIAIAATPAEMGQAVQQALKS
jgi:succinyl-CoA synthetase alpha subunit